MMTVDCGRCPACIQQKANYRARRIINNSVDILENCDRLFITLTYKNKYLPYIKYDELIDFKARRIKNLNVYRDKDVHLYYDRKSESIKEKTFDKGIVKTINFEDLDDFWKRDDIFVKEVHNFVRASGDRFNSVLYGRISVCLFDDIQRFFKRLRMNLKRSNYESSISYFACSEYGPTTDRSHFHIYLQVPKGDFAFIKSAVAKSWLYDDMDQRLNNIEFAVKPAEYIGNYVNCDRRISGLLQSRAFKQKHSYSQGFGFGKNAYSFDEVKKSYYRGDLRTFERIDRKGEITSDFVPIPKYVISRYFPKFKGFYKLTPAEVSSIVQEPGRIYWYRDKLELTVQHSKDIYIKLCNLNKKYGSYDYADIYSRIWLVRASNILKEFHRKMNDPLESYDNIVQFYTGEVCSDFVSLDDREVYKIDFNDFKELVTNTNRLTEQYYYKVKDRKVKNLVYSKHFNFNT